MILLQQFCRCLPCTSPCCTCSTYLGTVPCLGNLVPSVLLERVCAVDHDLIRLSQLAKQLGVTQPLLGQAKVIRSHLTKYLNVASFIIHVRVHHANQQTRRRTGLDYAQRQKTKPSRGEWHGTVLRGGGGTGTPIPIPPRLFSRIFIWESTAQYFVS